LRASLPTTIEIKPDIETTVDPIFADPTQIHPVIMNLCTNSAHAMEDTGGIHVHSIAGDILAMELMKIRPDIPVIICTGYSRRIDDRRAQELGIKGLIMKPFTIRNLSKTVRNVLDQKG
jgi:DNA-binding NarL/FixJ family response regulator